MAQPLEAFTRKVLRAVGSRLSLIERPDGDCIFYRDGCGVYPVRPAQCRAFPFWTINLRSPEAWRSAASTCPGIGVSPRRPFKQIARALRSCLL